MLFSYKASAVNDGAGTFILMVDSSIVFPSGSAVVSLEKVVDIIVMGMTLNWVVFK